MFAKNNKYELASDIKERRAPASCWREGSDIANWNDELAMDRSYWGEVG
jgi:hypothetical protein